MVLGAVAEKERAAKRQPRDLFPRLNRGIVRNSMIPLVAGGGFVPQWPIDSTQVVDSTLGWNAYKGHNGNFFIQFSFSFFL